MHRKDKHLGRRRRIVNLLRRLDAVQFRHRDIHHDDVGMQLVHEPHRLPPIGGRPYDLESGLRLQQHAQTVTHHGVIIREHHPDHSRLSATMVCRRPPSYTTRG